MRFMHCALAWNDALVELCFLWYADEQTQLQGGVGDKGVDQLEKSVTSKLKSVLDMAVPDSIQTYGIPSCFIVVLIKYVYKMTLWNIMGHVLWIYRLLSIYLMY